MATCTTAPKGGRSRGRARHAAAIEAELLAVVPLVMGACLAVRAVSSAILMLGVVAAVIVLFFVMISFVTRKLRIPNMYLYLAAVVVFNLVCYL